MKFIDAHCHSYLRGLEDLFAMAKCGVTHAVVCSFFPVKPQGASTLCDLFTWIDTVERDRLAKAHVEIIFAAGIHPRSIPPEKDVDAVLATIRSLVLSGRAHAIGEIGLETGATAERRVLQKQLTLASELQVPVVIHTPRNDKIQRVHQTVELISESKIPEHLVVLDHMTDELIADLRTLGHNFQFGLTLQTGKTSADDVFQTIQHHGSDGLQLNTDASHTASNPCALFECAKHLLELGIPIEEVAKLTFKNAAQFFGVGENPSSLFST